MRETSNTRVDIQFLVCRVEKDTSGGDLTLVAISHGVEAVGRRGMVSSSLYKEPTCRLHSRLFLRYRENLSCEESHPKSRRDMVGNKGMYVL